MKPGALTGTEDLGAQSERYGRRGESELETDSSRVRGAQRAERDASECPTADNGRHNGGDGCQP